MFVDWLGLSTNPVEDVNWGNIRKMVHNGQTYYSLEGVFESMGGTITRIPQLNNFVSLSVIRGSQSVTITYNPLQKGDTVNDDGELLKKDIEKYKIMLDNSTMFSNSKDETYNPPVVSFQNKGWMTKADIIKYFELLWCENFGEVGINDEVTTGDYTDFLYMLGYRESTDNYQSVNPDGYMGKYQLGLSAFVDIGWKDSDNHWTTDAKSYGVSSKQTFLDNGDAQEFAVRKLHKLIWVYLEANGATKFVGKTLNGIHITESGVLGSAHLLGAGGVKKALDSGDLESVWDGNGTKALEYMTLLGGYDISEIK